MDDDSSYRIRCVCAHSISPGVAKDRLSRDLGLFDSYVHSGYVEVLDACISSEMIGYSPKWVEFDFSRTKEMNDYWHGANSADKAELSL